jgi:hypothetical protein
MKQPISIDVTVRVVIEAESKSEAEELFEAQLFNQFPDAEYYNLQSREGSWSALYVGDSTDDTDVWRPSQEQVQALTAERDSLQVALDEVNIEMLMVSSSVEKFHEELERKEQHKRDLFFGNY